MGHAIQKVRSMRLLVQNKFADWKLKIDGLVAYRETYTLA
jgi:hypothetical protein